MSKLNNPLDAGGSVGGTSGEVAETQWTKGPWKVERLTDTRMCSIEVTGDDRTVAHLPLRLDAKELANARLIAAAPELYDALEAALEIAESAYCVPEWLTYGRSERTDSSMDLLRAALAKARGER